LGDVSSLPDLVQGLSCRDSIMRRMTIHLSNNCNSSKPPLARITRTTIMRNWSFLPRPEYPRPDRQRAFVEGAEWLNLNGAWEFRFDGEKEGVEQQWFVSSETPWREQILVPFCWESLAAWGEADSASNDNYFATRVFRNPLEVSRFNYRRAERYESAGTVGELQSHPPECGLASGSS
jgi:hypothetical protein